MLSEKSGDQQAKAELLGKLLIAAGEKPNMLRHGTDRDEYYLVLVGATDEEASLIAKATSVTPVIITLGQQKLLPLQVESEKKVGEIDAKYYNAEKKRWTSTIAVMRCE